MDMTNVAYTPEYQAKRQKWDAVFTEENLKETTEFSVEEYNFVRKKYSGQVHGCNIHSSETIVKNSGGEEIYRWRNQDDSCEFIKLIHHSNGCDYLLFRVDLYGYGVFDLLDRKEFFYVPKGPESFIWTDATYNPQSDMLAVEGCFWACPYSVHLVDFKEPMKESKWKDLFDILDGGYDNYDDIDFKRWDGDTLYITAARLITVDGKVKTTPEELALNREQYMELFE